MYSWKLHYWPWVSLALGGWGSWTLWGGIRQPTGLWMCPVAREGDVFGGLQTTLLLCCFTHCRISYRTSPVENRGGIWAHRRKTTQEQSFYIHTHSAYTLISTWAGTAASEVFLGEQAQGSTVHLKVSLFRPAQWVLLLSPVEPVGNILLIPQRWVYP